MRRASIAGACWLTAALALALPSPDLESILGRHRRAMGGEAAWAAWRTLRLTGTLSTGESGGIPYVLIYSNGRPGREAESSRFRFDFEVQGLCGFVAFDGEGGWARSPFESGPAHRLSPEQSARWRLLADIGGPLIDSGDAAASVRLVEIGTDGAILLGVAGAAGSTEELELDPKSYLIRRQRSQVRFGLRRQPIEVEVLLSDYRTVGDLKIAHTIESRAAGATAAQVLRVEKAEIDVELAADAFTVTPRHPPG